MDAPKDARSTASLAIGAALVAIGGWWFLRESGLLPSFVFSLIDRVSWPLTLVVVGVALVVAARRAHTPVPGARLYRSRGDRWVAGVFGGLGPYIGVDPVILRVVFIVLAIAGFGALIVAYIVAALLVPEEPQPQQPA
jgi:phage shock protein PspC (stress-responsive transcriptional regulator)